MRTKYILVDRYNYKIAWKDLMDSFAIIVDLETEGTDCFDETKDILYIGLTNAKGKGYIFPNNVRYHQGILEIINSCQLLVNQDLKFDLKWLLKKNIIPNIRPKIFCTHVAEHLLDENQFRNDLDFLASKYCDGELADYLKEWKARFKKEKYGAEWSPEEWRQYNGGDLDATCHIYEKQARRLEKEGLTGLMEFEMKNLKVLCYMEMNGFQIDDKVRKELRKKYEKQLEEDGNKLISLFGEINFNSPTQLAAKLYDEWKLPVLKRTDATKTKPTGSPSTDEETLIALGKLQNNKYKDRLEALLKYRYNMKMFSTYIAGLTDNYIMKADGKVHCNYKMYTVTGRLSCEAPNLQNIPRKGDIKRLFISSYKDGVLVQGDYSQAELRVLAHASGDPELIKAFKSGRDIHQEVAAKVFKLPYEKVSEEQRKFAKQVNFGIVYMIGPLGLSEKLLCSETRAKRLIEDWFREFKEVKKYIEREKLRTIKYGFVTNIFGRKRRLPGAGFDTGIGRAKLRQGVNSPIQGGAGDLTKWVGTRAHYQMKKLKLEGKVVCNVHDSVIIDCPKEYSRLIAKMLKEIAENPPVELRVPMKMDIKIGDRWSDLKEVSID